jgi:HTH-type transcriptional regulator / antitoxin HipB
MGDIMEQMIFTSFQLATVLRNRRKLLGITQKTAAEKVGLLPKTISLLENEPERCTIESLMKYFSALDLDLVLKPKNKETDSTHEW